MELITRNIRLTLSALFVLISLAYSENDDSLNTPFEKIVVVKNKDGTIEKKMATEVKKTSEGYEIQKAEGGVALFPLKSVVAIVPQYPKKGLQYGLKDVQNALKILRALPSGYTLPPEELKRWEAMEEILTASNPETAPSRANPDVVQAVKDGASEVAGNNPIAGVSLKNVIKAEELYQACKGPLGKEFVGKSVIVEGLVDHVDSFSLMDGFTKPKNISLIGAPRPGGSNYQVKCEIRGPVIFLFERGNLYARYVEFEERYAEKTVEGPSGPSKTKIKKPIFYTVDDQSIENASDRIDTNVEFPLIQQGNRLMIAQKMKIVGLNRMGDLELVGANIQKEPLSWDEIQAASEKQRAKVPAAHGSDGKYKFKDLFIEIEQ